MLTVKPEVAKEEKGEKAKVQPNSHPSQFQDIFVQLDLTVKVGLPINCTHICYVYSLFLHSILRAPTFALRLLYLVFFKSISFLLS